MAKELGTVAALAAAWGLRARLDAARRIGRGYDECLACRVEISRRAKTVAGKAYAAERRIMLNARLLLPGREADRDATFLHECAHIIADIRYQAHCRHDGRWRRIMDLLGEPARVSHDIAYLSPRAHAVVVWACAQCGERFHYARAPRRRLADCYCRRCGPRLGRLFVVGDRDRAAPVAAGVSCFSKRGDHEENDDE